MDARVCLRRKPSPAKATTPALHARHQTVSPEEVLACCFKKYNGRVPATARQVEDLSAAAQVTAGACVLSLAQELPHAAHMVKEKKARNVSKKIELIKIK